MLIGYARVSTVDQNPQLQIDALEQAGCERIFTEHASGAQRDRPQLRAALEYARCQDSLVVWKLDRLARSTRQLLETVETLQARGVGLRSLTEAIDTTSAGGRLILHVFAAIGEFERSLVIERTRAGLQAARKMGRTGGRPRAMNEQDAAVARAMLRSSEVTVEEVARRLGVSAATLYRHLPGGRSAIHQTD